LCRILRLKLISALAPPKGGRFLQIVAGDLHFCALSVTNKVHCWGIGIPTDPNDTRSDTDFRGQASPPDGDFTYLASGRYHSCAIRTNGSTVCWGYNKSGQAQPIQEQFIEIDGGLSNTCGITKDLRVVCWGSNTGNRSTPPADLKLLIPEDDSVLGHPKTKENETSRHRLVVVATIAAHWRIAGCWPGGVVSRCCSLAGAFAEMQDWPRKIEPSWHPFCEQPRFVRFD